MGKARKGKPRRRKCASDPGAPPCIPAGQDGCFDATSCCTGASCRQDSSCRTGSCALAGADCPNGAQDCCYGNVCTQAGKCCGGQGATCAAAGDCCGDLECNGAGVCVATCEGGLVACNETADCCFGRTCTENSNERNECCALDGEACDPNQPNGHCCNPASGCFEGGLCGACIFQDSACSPFDDPSKCCNGLICDGGSYTCIAEGPF